MSAELITPEGMQLLGQRMAVQQCIDEWSKLPSMLHLCKLDEYFLPGLYIRRLSTPAGLQTAGRIHKYPCLNFLESGKRATVIDGQGVVITAPHWHMTGVGHQRASFIIEDSVWYTLHWFKDAEKMTPEERVSHFTAETEEDFQAFIGLMTMDAPRCLS